MISEPPPGRQFVILARAAPTEPGAMAPIGSRRDIGRKLADRNTGPESEQAHDVLYGPGIRIELTPNQDPITQMLVTVTEEEIGCSRGSSRSSIGSCSTPIPGAS